jgi:hypothetical protein
VICTVKTLSSNTSTMFLSVLLSDTCFTFTKQDEDFSKAYWEPLPATNERPAPGISSRFLSFEKVLSMLSQIFLLKMHDRQMSSNSITIGYQFDRILTPNIQNNEWIFCLISLKVEIESGLLYSFLLAILHPRSFSHTCVTSSLCTDFQHDSVSCFMLIAVSPLRSFRDSKKEIFLRV